MDPCIVESANFHMHLHHQTMRTNLPARPDPCLVASFIVIMPGAGPRHSSYTFYYSSLHTALPYCRHWQMAVEHMILTAAGDAAPALDLAQLVGDFCTYSQAAFDRFRSLPGHFLFLSAVVEGAPDSAPGRFYFFPFPEAMVHVEQSIFNPVTLAGGSDPSPLPIWSTIDTVVFGGEAAAEGDRQSSCAVCLEEYEEGELLDALPCGHRFHSSCVTEWLRKQPTCPLCRRSVPEYNLFLKSEL